MVFDESYVLTLEYLSFRFPTYLLTAMAICTPVGAWPQQNTVSKRLSFWRVEVSEELEEVKFKKGPY